MKMYKKIAFILAMMQLIILFSPTTYALEDKEIINNESSFDNSTLIKKTLDFLKVKQTNNEL